MGHNQAKAAQPRDASKEPAVQQIASFVGFFVYLLVLKSFFLPLFVIPTGSMAETLFGEHAIHTCPNCGFEYPVGMSPQDRRMRLIRCPNCHWQESTAPEPYGFSFASSSLAKIASPISQPLHARAGDRIVVHGWTYDLGHIFGPHRWDVVVFKVPSDMTTNYIKRLIGKPGETIEIIDGDIYVAPPGGKLAIAHKPHRVQQSLWFPYYNNDFRPIAPSQERFFPRWVTVGKGRGWHGLDTRRPSFEGRPGEEGRITFVTDPGPTVNPGLITDVYGYDRSARDVHGNVIAPEQHVVSDVRLSCSVQFDKKAPPDAFLELSTTKNGDTFFGRIYADGRLTLERVGDKRGARQLWGSAQLKRPPTKPVVFALSSVDYVVSLEVNGVVQVHSTPEQYHADVQKALAHSRNPTSPRLLITAGGGRVSLAHLLIERDEYYTSELSGGLSGYGTQGHPITLGPNEYFMLGDNSPCSQDSRYSFVSSPREPLLAADVDPHYHRGTVPGDQLIGPAFLVYFPGMGELLPDRYMNGPLRFLNVLPTPGRIRWIR